MLKTLNMVLFCSPVGFYEQINAVFQRKILKLGPKMTKVSNFPIFKEFMHFFHIFSILCGFER